MMRLMLPGCLLVGVLACATPAYAASELRHADGTQETWPDDPLLLLKFTPTGDALWDRFAQTTLDLLKERSEQGTPWNDLPVYSPQLLAEWEPDFGTDPRYWQLCFWACWRAVPASPTEPWVGPADPPGGEAILLRAIAADAADATIYWTLLNIQLSRAHPDWARFEELLSGFIARYPEEAAGWYRRGALRLQQGRYAEAEADLAAGNAAPSNSRMRIFPASHVAEGLTSNGLLGSLIVADIGRYGYRPEWGETYYLDMQEDSVKLLHAAQSGSELRLAATTLLHFLARSKANYWLDDGYYSQALDAPQQLLGDVLALGAGDFSEQERRSILELRDALAWNKQWVDKSYPDFSSTLFDTELFKQGLDQTSLAEMLMYGDLADEPNAFGWMEERDRFDQLNGNSRYRMDLRLLAAWHTARMLEEQRDAATAGGFILGGLGRAERFDFADCQEHDLD
jgi:hypothetical protein